MVPAIPTTPRYFAVGTSLNPQLDPHLSLWHNQTVSHSRHRYWVSVPPWFGRCPSLFMYL